MTPEDLDHLRFNTPIYSHIDDTTWYYDHRPNDGTVIIFKELVDNIPEPSFWGLSNRNRYYGRINREPWERVGSLTIPMSMLLEDFDLMNETIHDDLEFVKKIDYLMQPYSLVKGNPHMIKGLPF
jgi:hypothetical protein